MPTPISISEYIALMQTSLQRGLSKNELEHIERCQCGKDYCHGWKTQLDSPYKPQRMEV